jgi:hypothetical protein
LPQALKLCEEELARMDLLLPILKSLKLALKRLLRLLEVSSGVCEIIAGLNPLRSGCCSGSRHRRSCGYVVVILIVVPSLIRHTELSGQLSDLLSISGEAKPERSEIENSRSLLWLLLLLRLLALRRRLLLSILGLILGIWTASIGDVRSWCCWGRGATTNLYAKSSSAVTTIIGSLSSHGASACWAHLLPLQPTLEAPEVQSVATRQLLGAHAIHSGRIPRSIPWPHLFTADNACVFAS